VRITSTENAAEAVLWPVFRRTLPDNPDIKVEIVIDYGLTNIVMAQIDAGVRQGARLKRI
jgi:DNA-binding transcriptional LysR family regulator